MGVRARREENEWKCICAIVYFFLLRVCVKVTLQGRFLFFSPSNRTLQPYAPYKHCTHILALKRSTFFSPFLTRIKIKRLINFFTILPFTTTPFLICYSLIIHSPIDNQQAAKKVVWDLLYTFIYFISLSFPN